MYYHNNGKIISKVEKGVSFQNVHMDIYISSCSWPSAYMINFLIIANQNKYTRMCTSVMLDDFTSSMVQHLHYLHSLELELYYTYMYNIGVDIEHMPCVDTAQSIEMTIIIATAILKFSAWLNFVN